MFKKVKSFFFFFVSRQNQSFFKSSFFPVVIIEWNKIDVHIRNSGSCNVFYRIILKFIRPELNQVFNVDSSEGLKFLARTRLARLRKSYLQICSCGQEIETSTHFFDHSSNYHCTRQTFYEK